MMESKQYFCRPEDEFSFEELVKTIGPLNEFENGLFSLIKAGLMSTPEISILWEVRRTVYFSDVSDLDKIAEYELNSEIFYVQLLENAPPLLSVFGGMTEDEAWDMVYGCDHENVPQKKELSDAARCLMLKIISACRDLGFIRSNLMTNDRRLEYIMDNALGDYEISLFEYLEETEGAYEAFINEDATVVLKRIFKYLKNILPPLQFEVYKFNITSGLLRCAYFSDKNYSNFDPKPYTEFEFDLLAMALENVRDHDEDIFSLVIA